LKASPSKNQDPISKNTQHKKRAGQEVQAVEHLPSQCETLNSTPILPKPKEKEKDPMRFFFTNQNTQPRLPKATLLTLSMFSLVSFKASGLLRNSFSKSDLAALSLSRKFCRT
jgi:hypothetical protein